MAEIIEEQKTITEVPEEGAKSNKMLFQENLKKKYPDTDFSNEDDFYRVAMEGYDKDHEWKKRAMEENKFMAEKLADNPDIAGFLSDLVEGKHPKVAAENLRELFERTPEDYDAYNADKKAKSDAEKAKVKEYEDNLAQSSKDIEAFAEETGRTEEDIKSFIEDITEDIFVPLMEGKISIDLLRKLDNMYNRDADIASAEEAGFLKGKNEKIVDTKLKKAGDGIPSLKGKGGVQSNKPKQEQWLADLEAKADLENKKWGR